MSLKPHKRAGWFVLRAGGAWLHESSGTQVQHCGHPTANYPYVAILPDGRWLLSGGIGMGYAHRTLQLAMEAVEKHFAIAEAA
jgi:hypothetical protein